MAVKDPRSALRYADHVSFHRADSFGYNNSVEDAAFSDEFCSFLRAMVPNVAAAELLLELRAQGERGIAPRSVADRLVLDTLAANRVAMPLPDGRFVYRAPPAIDAHIVILTQAYRERPVTLFRIIYALRDGKVQSFADAFRLRKD